MTRSLRELVTVWESAAADFVALVRELRDDEWLLPTDCRGWSVHDVLAHTAALESELAGNGAPTSEPPAEQSQLKNPSREHIEQGVLARRDTPSEQLIDELAEAVNRRTGQLRDEPLDDPNGTPPITPGTVGWDWATLLRNRPFDLWVHEQDIRRATGRPGDLDTETARHAQSVFAEALPFVVAKVASAPPGTAVVVDITGPVSGVYAARVGDDRRGALVDPAVVEPTVKLTMDTETFAVLGAGRRDPATLPVKVDGDAGLAERVLSAMAVTP